MHPRLIAAAALVAAAGLAAAPDEARAFETETDVRFAEKVVGFSEATPAPDTPIDLLNGRETSLGAHRGRVLLVTMWANWCEVCAVELPMLAPLAWRLPPTGVDVLPVSVDIEKEGAAPVDQVLAYLTDARLAGLPVMVDRDHAMAAAVGLRGTPTTLIVDKFGNVAAAFEGQAPLEDPAFFDYLEKLVAAPSAEASLKALGD